MTLTSMMRNYMSGSPLSPDADETPAGGKDEARTQGMKEKSRTRLVSNIKGITSGTFSLLLVSLVMAIMMLSLIPTIYANPTCILNCAQCVKIYGDFFDGHSCAKVCMESRTKFESFVDCADPTTIARFLKSY